MLNIDGMSSVTNYLLCSNGNFLSITLLKEVELTMAREASQRKNRASSAEEIIAKRKQLSEDREQQEKQENRGEEL